ncbi:T9SS type A sorting domain-containing protein [Fibrivirga algicola]|uniref:T9SS type A sorting domain-containing protein n=1 Tax=Fibrivirga algicola TaxID=2950420 RepID=A0ABX0QP08_9BACT|nr:T9SS type A sorting domain-containing protein [Fibrivirga algicola]NID13523.1 T9SS type A sorting domain-containing protein [Fibrivirga algicola]
MKASRSAYKRIYKMGIGKKIIILILLVCSLPSLAQITFAPPICSELTNIQVGSHFYPLGDFNGDGKIDMAIQELSNNRRTSNIAIYFGNGDGSFKYFKSIDLSNHVGISGIISADYNNDKILDLAVYITNKLNLGFSDVDEYLLIFRGDGAGNFTQINSISLGINRSNIIYSFTNTDFNGDGYTDLAVSKKAEYVISIYIGNGKGEFSVAGSVNFGFGSSIIDVISMDMNGDKKDDLVLSDIGDNKGISIILGNDKNNFSSKNIRNFDGGVLSCKDFNNDGIIDIASYSPSGLTILLADTSLHFSHLPALKLSDTFYTSPLIGEDFNNDNKIDLAVKGPNELFILIGDGTGKFITGKERYQNGSSFMSSSDFNGDGKIDIFIPQTSCSTLSNGGFSTLLNTTLTQSIDFFPKSSGNGGDVTISFSGLLIKTGINVKLVKNGAQDISASQILLPREFEAKATFDLRNKELGDYDIIIIDASGVVINRLKEFKIVSFKKPDIWVQIAGPDLIRSGRPSTFIVQVGNKGNCNATGIPIFLFVTGNNKVEFMNNFSGLNGQKLDTLIYSSRDSLFGSSIRNKSYWLLIPELSLGSIKNIEIQVTSLTNNEEFEIRAVVNSPLFASPLPAEKEECHFALAKVVMGAVLSNIKDEIIGDALQCLDGGISTFNNGLNIYRNWGYNNNIDIMDFGYGFASTLYSCASTASIFLPQLRVVKVLDKVFDVLDNTVGSGLNGAQAAVKCRDVYDLAGNRGSKRIRSLNSVDPNDKIGVGITSKHHITGNEPLQYGIRFENNAKATADAQVVRIIDTLDRTKFDLSTFQLNFFNFSGKYVNIIPGQKKRIELIDLRPQKNLILKIVAELDEMSGIFTTECISLDPKTLKLTSDPILGFLPPNVNAPEGEGGIYYTVAAKSDLPNNTTINNKALIYFDTNAPISTPVWSNSLDKVAPSSYVSALPAITTDTTFTIKWQGTDRESGIERYDIYYSVNNKIFKPLTLNTKNISYKFTGKADSTYSFYSIAVDSVGNREIIPTSFDAKTTIGRILSIKPILNDNFNIYPNPAKNTIYIETEKSIKIDQISLFSINGKKIEAKVKSFTDGKYQLTISNIPTGVYLLNLANKYNVVTRKIIIE